MFGFSANQGKRNKNKNKTIILLIILHFNFICLILTFSGEFVDIIATKNGRRALIYKGYRYKINHELKCKTHWRCSKRWCKATLHTVKDTIVFVSDSRHTCNNYQHLWRTKLNLSNIEIIFKNMYSEVML